MRGDGSECANPRLDYDRVTLSFKKRSKHAQDMFFVISSLQCLDRTARMTPGTVGVPVPVRCCARQGLFPPMSTAVGLHGHVQFNVQRFNPLRFV